MNTLLIGSQTLCIRNLYSRIPYAYVTRTLAFVMHTYFIRYAYGDKGYTD